eukprot:3670791-Amphidinium_carterae.2
MAKFEAIHVSFECPVAGTKHLQGALLEDHVEGSLCFWDLAYLSCSVGLKHTYSRGGEHNKRWIHDNWGKWCRLAEENNIPATHLQKARERSKQKHARNEYSEADRFLPEASSSSHMLVLLLLQLSCHATDTTNAERAKECLSGLLAAALVQVQASAGSDSPVGIEIGVGKGSVFKPGDDEVSGDEKALLVWEGTSLDASELLDAVPGLSKYITAAEGTHSQK